MDDKFCPSCFKKFGEEQEKCTDCEIRLVSSMDKDLSGSVLDDRYEVIKTLGKGGMGVVYHARQRIIDRPVALKVLRRELVQDEASVKRFMVEAKAVSSLRNAHTITLFDFGITQAGLLYFTMELLEGTSLTDLIRKRSPLSVDLTFRIVLQVCESLREAHAKGILHRDLKPDNIFIIDGDDGSEHSKVLDFGIAKMLDDGSSESITKTGMICGTPMYLSPEQAVGKSLDARSDIYSLGIIMYEMLSGAPPFVDATPVGILMKQVSEMPLPVSTRNPDATIPASIERFLMRILAKHPDERPQSIEQMMKELGLALETADSDDQVPMATMTATTAGVQMPTAAYLAETSGHAGDRTTEPLLSESISDTRERKRVETAEGEALPTEHIDVGPVRSGPPWGLIGGVAAVLLVVGFGIAFAAGMFGGKNGDVGGDIPAAKKVSAEVAGPEGVREPVEEARPASASREVAERSKLDDELALQQDLLEKTRTEAAARASELEDRERMLKEKEEALNKTLELAERERLLKEREEAQTKAEAAARAVREADEARKKAEEEEARLLAEKAAADKEAQEKAAAADNEEKLSNGAAAKRAAQRKRKEREERERRKKEEEKKKQDKKKQDKKKQDKKKDDDDELDFEKI
jgi:serine/threonine protein kinase